MSVIQQLTRQGWGRVPSTKDVSQCCITWMMTQTGGFSASSLVDLAHGRCEHRKDYDPWDMMYRRMK